MIKTAVLKKNRKIGTYWADTSRKNASHGEVGVAQRAQLANTNAITRIFCLLRGSIEGRV